LASRLLEDPHASA
jgi:hypothetical protein